MSAEPARRAGVFCGAKPGHRPGFLDCARDLGTALGSSGIDLVYDGSAGGLMGELADAVLHSGGHVIALPGGFGTLDELFEILTWRKLSIVDKRPTQWPSSGRRVSPSVRDRESR